MPRSTRIPGLAGIFAAAFVAALAYGATFPILALRLESSGVTGFELGLNASMPALGWLIGSLAAPRLQGLFGIRRLALGFIAISIAAWSALALTESFWPSTLLRFFFGGAAGMFFRSLEYWINGLSWDARRGRDLATFNLHYVLGLVAGTVVQPELGSVGVRAFAPVVGCLALAGLIVALWPRLANPGSSVADRPKLTFAMLAIAPAAFVAILAYGLFEHIPVYLSPIFALKKQLGDAVAAYTLTAATLGNLLLPLPIAMLSDRIGRRPAMLMCALLAASLSLAIPLTLHNASVFLCVIGLWAGSAGALYSVALAEIGDRFGGTSLIAANAGFGLVYASGCLVGPLCGGAVMEIFGIDAIMPSAAAIFLALVVALLGIETVRSARAPS